MNSKYNFKGKSVYNQNSNEGVNNQVFYYGIVTSVVDSNNSGEISVRVKGVDDHLTMDKLPTAFPLQPKFIYIKPKVGETVLVFTPENDNPFTNRFYLGPLISQPQYLNDSSLTTLNGSIVNRESAKRIPEARGVYSEGDDLTIQGRKNTDILFKNDEILLRTGKADFDTKVNTIPTFNKKNQAYIQIKSNIKAGAKKFSVTNIVASKINFLTHDDGNPLFDLHDQDEQISNESLAKILNEAHPAVFGDKMVEYFLLLRNVLLTHVHAYPGLKAQDLNGEENIKKLLEFDLKSLISKNIRLN
jgi:hypothetical protein